MEELTKIARLLGEDNEKKLKDGIVELFLNQVKLDLEEKCKYEFCIDFDDIFDEAKEEFREEIKEEIKERCKRRYAEYIEQKMMEFMGS
jgi:hypothetical protein